MAVTVYKSTDASAPVLTGQVGSLSTLLNTVLVTGYGAQPAAGWTRPFTGTNGASFRMVNDGTGTGFFLNIDDNGPDASAGGAECRAAAFETMSAFNTGTGRFPSGATNLFIVKSETADATARPWIIVADNKTFYLFINCGGSTNKWTAFTFGDIYSLKTGDLYRCLIAGRSATSNRGQIDPTIDNLQVINGTCTAATAGHFMPRNYLGSIQAAVAVGKHCGDQAKRGLIPYPNPADNSLALAQLWIHEDVGIWGVPRGRMRGLWDILHPATLDLPDGTTFSGSGPLAGKTFLVIKPGAGEGSMQIFILETSNTWETSV